MTGGSLGDAGLDSHRSRSDLYTWFLEAGAEF